MFLHHIQLQLAVRSFLLILVAWHFWGGKQLLEYYLWHYNLSISNHLKYFGTYYFQLLPFETICDLSRLFETIWDHLEPFWENNWDHLRPIKTILRPFWSQKSSISLFIVQFRDTHFSICSAIQAKKYNNYTFRIWKVL